MKNEIKLIPTYVACVSGGKDSLLMLQVILKNPDKYPLDYVLHCELDIDYPFIKNVVDEMENMCEKVNIPLIRIKPRKSWEELYYKPSPDGTHYWGFPTRVSRWCNEHYKIDSVRQMKEWLRGLGREMFTYIGYCVDEVKRYENRKEPNEIYPLVMENIEESYILSWAKEQPCFNNYYKFFNRCGCMRCPFVTQLELAYQLKYYPEEYEKYIFYVRDTEEMWERGGRKSCVRSSNPKYNWEYTDTNVRTKWLAKLEEKERENL